MDVGDERRENVVRMIDSTTDVRWCVAVVAAATPAAAFRAPELDAAAAEDAARQLRALRRQAQGTVHRERLRLSGRPQDPGAQRQRADRHRLQGRALLRRLPRAVGRGAGEAGRVHRQHLLARSLPLGHLPRSQRPGARLHPGEVLRRDQPAATSSASCGPSAASPAPSTRAPPRRASSSATSPRPEFNDTRDFLLAYELQKRFFVRDDVGQIEKVRVAGGAHPGGRSQVQAAARCGPQPDLRRPHPAARRLPRHAAARVDAHARSTSSSPRSPS